MFDNDTPFYQMEAIAQQRVDKALPGEVNYRNGRNHKRISVDAYAKMVHGAYKRYLNRKRRKQIVKH